MRKTLFLTLLLAASVVSFARQADQSVIRKVAINFYYQHAGVSTSLNYNSIGIKDMTPSEYHGRIVYYTLNMAPAGWIVVAADDAVVPVLAYSFRQQTSTILRCLPVHILDGKVFQADRSRRKQKYPRNQRDQFNMGRIQ